MIDCPKCTFQFESGEECPRCGVIIARALARQRSENAPKPTPKQPPALSTSRPGLAISTRQRAVFLRQLGQILDSGMSIHAGLDVLGGASSKPALQRLAGRLKSGLDDGKSLSESFSSCGVLSPLGLRMLKTHEQAGGLPEFFFDQADHIEERLRLRNDFLTALVYPGLVLILSVFLLPLPTLVLKGTSPYLMIVLGELGVLAVVGLALWLVPAYLFRSIAIRSSANTVLWHTPLIGGFYRQQLRSDLARSLARGLDAGMTPREILPALSDLCQAGEFQRAMAQALDASARGEPMMQILSETLIQDPAHRLMLTTGEESGHLVDSLQRIGADLRERLRRNLRVTLQVVSVLAVTAVILLVALQTISAYQSRMKGFHDSVDQVMKESGVNVKNPTDLKELKQKFKETFDGVDKHPEFRKELKGVIDYGPSRKDNP